MLLLVIVIVAAVAASSAAMVTTSKRVQGRHRALGVRRQMTELLDAWDAQGTHDVIIPEPIRGVVAPPGLRTVQDQLDAFAAGLTEATTIVDTAHGRGFALDVHPVDFNPRVAWERQPADVRAKFEAFGVFAERFTASDGSRFVWGGRWRTAKLPYGDQPHVEVKDWRKKGTT